MTVYRIRSPQASLNGHVGAVDFCGGMGSTSSLTDAVDLLELGKGFKLVGLTDEEKAKVRQFQARRRADKARGAAERKVQEDFERTPEYTAKCVARMEEAKKASPEWKAARLLEKQLRRHSGVRLKKIK